MRISVDGGGYVAAATAFTDANHLVALQHDSLSGKLGAYAAMAGDDAGASEFAQAYDEAAVDALAALADLTGSFATLSRLTAASLDNHRRAESASIIAGAVVHDGSPVGDADLVGVLPATPPTSLGGDPPALSDEESWILDHVESFVWPNADTDLLRDAAHTWRTTAEALDHLTDHCDAAASGLASERSPEIPLALDAIDDVRDTVRHLVAQLSALASACDDYAGHVDAKRAELKALLGEILRMVVEGVVISVAITIITGGAGTAIAAGAVAARVAAQSPRFAAILTALRSLTSATALQVRVARDGVLLARARLDKFLRVPARTDRGHFTWGNAYSRGWLGFHEKVDGHTILKHVGQTAEELHERIRRSRHIREASTFRSQADAERLLERLFREQGAEIQGWLHGGGKTLKLRGRFDETTGMTALSTGETLAVRGVRAILVRDDSMRFGYRIKTAFPEP